MTEIDEGSDPHDGLHDLLRQRLIDEGLSAGQAQALTAAWSTRRRGRELRKSWSNSSKVGSSV